MLTKRHWLRHRNCSIRSREWAVEAVIGTAITPWLGTNTKEGAEKEGDETPTIKERRMEGAQVSFRGHAQMTSALGGGGGSQSLTQQRWLGDFSAIDWSKLLTRGKKSQKFSRRHLYMAPKLVYNSKNIRWLHNGTHYSLTGITWWRCDISLSVVLRVECKFRCSNLQYQHPEIWRWG